jgi:molybdate transport system substrate-binding protein
MSSACVSTDDISKKELTIFAASSLTNVFAAIVEDFEEVHTDVEVAVNFGGSSTLRSQLEHGAKADLFVSADMHQVNIARNAGLIEGEPIHFANNSLAVVVPVEDSKIMSLDDLMTDGVKLVIGMEQVPIGRYTRILLDNLDTHYQTDPNFSARVLGNVVSEEMNVRQVIAKVNLGEADAGIVYESDVDFSYFRSITIPNSHNVDANYYIVFVTKSVLAKQFSEFLFTPSAVQVLRNFGLSVDEER